ncbi:MAG: hypothetical protein LBG59_04135 [Candidatus Peribacteria bacterium]|nr:hypothetical protein [Candidatus Peribacteria bacterium]
MERYEAGKRGQLINVGLIVPSTRWLEWRKSIIDAFTENIDAFNKISSTSLIRLKVVDGACEEGWMSTSSPQRVDVYASVVCSMSTGSELEFKRIAHDATQGVLELFPRGALSEEMDIPECRIPPKTPFLRLCGRNPRTLTR